MFASLNVLKELQKHYGTDPSPKDPLKGIIWHTQGSGKTALTYHLTKLIRDFFSRSNLNKKTKFYFIVDRLDLLEQAKNEFSKRGLCVHEAENKEDLSQKLKNSNVFEGSQGNDEIIVVNIQKFKSPNEEKAPNEDPLDSMPKEIISKTELQEAAKDSHDLQRVFIIDEAHRSYDPKGCFYANLIECDKTAIKIALTGTPLLEDNAQDKATKKTFGDYLHTYSCAESISDRHTLKLQLEIIEKSYKEKLQAIYRLLQESITIEDIEVKKETIFNHERYIKEMLSYIIRDLLNFRRVNNDENLKAMVVCFSSAQAKLANWLFNEVQEKVLQENPNLRILKKLQSSLILHDEQEVKEKIYSFKHEDTDIVFVFNMLLTGFDLPNLKRLYIHRELKDHNLLQALARVNRPYNNMSFGYLIDFVGIKENYDKTTDDYLKELNQFNQGDSNIKDNLKDMFADRNILEKDIKNAYDDLFDYPIDDVEDMTSAIVGISGMSELLKVSRAINTLKINYNLIRTSNDEKILSLKEKIDIEKISKISSMLGKKAKQLHALKNINEPKNPNDLMILEDLIALLDFKIEFKESKELRFKEKEEISAKYKQAKEMLEKIPDKQDKEVQKISKELSKLIQEPLTNDNFDGISHSYSAIISQLKQHKEQTTNLLNKYNNDRAYVITHKRLHDRLMEENISNDFFLGVPNIPKNDKSKMPIYTLFFQHCLNMLSPKGKGAIVVPTGFISAKSGVENKIVRHLVDERLVYGVVCMPSQVFANTGTNVSIIFFQKTPSAKEVILIDASKLGEEYTENKNKKTRLRPSDMDLILETFQKKTKKSDFCALVSFDEITEKNYSLNPGQYFTIEDTSETISQAEFENLMQHYSSELASLFDESQSLQQEILETLGNLNHD
ncbi:N-6 DNA methylase [Helicobacter pylori]|nr:N-6 DNA methylase [Helicobacter pylori]